MKYIILCGGIGKRNNNYSLPKPLNYINGKHMIIHSIQNIPSNEIYIIYNSKLKDYNFEEIIINEFKNYKFNFSTIDYLTRGAVESAYVGINNLLIPNDESVVFIDNDNIHNYPKTMVSNNSFIGYSIDYEKTNYSFINIENELVSDIQEKNKISDYYCCGIYGFKNINVFKKHALELLKANTKSKNEFYFSTLYKLMIDSGEKIYPLKIENTFHLGSKTEIETNDLLLKPGKLRVCFDLDNTLVTGPTIPNDYTSVNPISKNIKLLRDLKKHGHEIIIYTARRMKTHNNNIGKVLKDIALITFNTLEEFNIPYDEIIFGKPLADIYIDDKAINPYINDLSFFGIFFDTEEDLNTLSINKYNKIIKKNDIVIKSGPESFLNGEVYFYQNLPEEIKNYFPEFLTYNKVNTNIEIKMSFINGIPLFYLYKNKLITENLLDKLFSMVSEIHNIKSVPIDITEINVKNNYIKKIKERFNKIDYSEDNSETILNNIIEGLETNFTPKIVNVIHGDLWFSNIILDYNDKFKLLDMRGCVDNILTLNGDVYYDYGKLYQSIVGLDMIIHGIKIDCEYINLIKEIYLNKCMDLGLNIEYLKYVTKSLIFGSIGLLPVSKNNIKKCLLNLIETL
jgi:capsule biosynthesis phosphatase